MKIDTTPIMEAVERVIARHERYVGYCKAREARQRMRALRKLEAALDAAIIGVNAVTSSPPEWYFGVVASHVSKTSAIRSMPSAIFCLEKPKIDPARQRAYNRGKGVASSGANIKIHQGNFEQDRSAAKEVVNQINSATVATGASVRLI